MAPGTGLSLLAFLGHAEAGSGLREGLSAHVLLRTLTGGGGVEVCLHRASGLEGDEGMWSWPRFLW